MTNTIKVKIFNSSAISVAKRDEERLTITFSSGGKYYYDYVPSEIIDGLWNAESAGRYYHENIRGKFASEKI